MQLCAQALCLEAQLGTTKPEGHIWSMTSRQRSRVVFDEELRETTRQVAGACLEMIEAGTIPPNEYDPRCEPCSLQPICLPRETAAYRRAVRRLPGDALEEGEPEEEWPGGPFIDQADREGG